MYIDSRAHGERLVNLLKYTTLATCVLFGAACRANDLAADRKALQEAVDAAVEKYPELADPKKAIAKRIQGKNGWDDFIKLTEQWAKICAADKDGEWSHFFEYIHDPDPSAYSDDDRAQMRIGLERSQPIADGAAKLLEFDCLIADPSDPSDVEKSVPILSTISFFGCLNSRAVVMSALGRPPEDISSAALLSYKLAMKTELSIHLTGCFLTQGVRGNAVERALKICEKLPKRVALLESLVAITPSRQLGPRDWWMGETAFGITQARRLLAMTDKELTAEYDKEWKAFYESVSDMLKVCSHAVKAGVDLVEKFPLSASIASTSHAEALTKAAEASMVNAPRGKGLRINDVISSFVQVDLTEGVEILKVHLRLHEARRASWPDDKVASELAARFPGIRIEREGKNLKIDAVADHPVRRLVDGKLLILPQTLEPWAQ
jgi:hypothetical protein